MTSVFGGGITGVYGGGTTEPPSVLLGKIIVYAGMVDAIVLAGQFVISGGHEVIVILVPV